jgi:hypothetical protein
MFRLLRKVSFANRWPLSDQVKFETSQPRASTHVWFKRVAGTSTSLGRTSSARSRCPRRQSGLPVEILLDGRHATISVA